MGRGEGLIWLLLFVSLFLLFCIFYALNDLFLQLCSISHASFPRSPTTYTQRLSVLSSFLSRSGLEGVRERVIILHR